MRRVILEGDSKTVVNELKVKKQNGSYFGMIISDTQATMSNYEGCLVRHILHEGNSIDHDIGKAALYVSECIVEMEETPILSQFI